MPSLRLDGGYSYNRTVNEAGFALFNLSNGPAIGATLQVPLYNGGSVRSQEKIARLNADNARVAVSMTQQRLEAQAIKSYEAYRTALGQLDQQEESFALASQVLDIQLQRFSVGQSTILDLRAAQSSFEQTAASLVNARYIAKLAETELRRLMCRLGS
jgi:outer membrane protein TolC